MQALRALAGLGYELTVLSSGTPAMIGDCTIGQPPDLTVPALDYLPAVLAG